jgi:hypothetical protein
MDFFLQNTTINGGTIELPNSRKMTITSNAIFNNVKVNLRNASSIVSNGTLSMTNAQFKFYTNSSSIFNIDVQSVTSTFSFLDNTNMNATAGNFNITKSSILTAGDGTTTSKAFIKFSGATLNIYDNSFVSIANYNNYYFNWNNYNAATNNVSVKTTDNKMNCNSAGKNACATPNLYGPSSLSNGGFSSSATLPVKLTAMDVKMVNNKVSLTWTTAQEMNSSRFEIERSIDGINWTNAGTVAAKGNASSASKYVFTENAKSIGTASYRLKMIDLDESFEYSPIKILKIAAATHEMNVYPNPATNFVVISSNDPASNMQVQLINYNGQVVKQVKGSSSVNMSVSEFNAGNYLVKVADASGSFRTFKLMITK